MLIAFYSVVLAKKFSSTYDRDLVLQEYIYDSVIKAENGLVLKDEEIFKGGLNTFLDII